MEDYNEKVNYGTESSPLLRERLNISSTLYGYNLFDKKEKKNLLFSKSKESCEEGKALLIAGKIELFNNSFKKRIEHEEIVVPNKIIVDYNRDGEDYYSIPTLKDLYKVALHILEQRFENKYFYRCNLDKDLDYTYEDIEKMPESFRKDAKNKLDSHIYYNKKYKEANLEYDLIEKAISEKNGSLAWSIIKNRVDNENEKYEIINPIKL